MGCWLAILVAGLVLYFILKGKKDNQERLGTSARPMGSGTIQPHTFPCPHAKCPNCAAAGAKMKQQWDGFRTVTWTCGYCGWTQPQELRDEELPPSARQRLGLDAPQQGLGGPQGYPGGYQGGGGSGLGGLMTGMMLGSMLGGSNHHHDHHDQGGWGGGSGDSGGDWGSGGDSGGDWGSGDSGGGDWGGGDSGGDWGGGGDSGGDW